MFARNCLRTFVCGIIVGLVLAAAIAIWLAIAYWPRPGPGPVSPEMAVIPDSSPGERRAADMVIRETRAGTLTGVVKLLPRASPPAAPISPGSTPGAGGAAALGGPVPDDHSPISGVPSGAEPAPVNPEPDSDLPEEASHPPAGLAPGMVVTVPVKGEIEATYVDARTGELLGVSMHPVTGETMVEVTEELDLRVTTRFEDEIVLAIALPDRRFWVGLTGQVSLHEPPRIGVFIDYRRELARLGRAMLVAGGSIEIYPRRDLSDSEILVTAQIGLVF